MTRSLLVLTIVLLPSAAVAQTIYKCIDASGGTLISNARVDKSCRAIVSNPDNSVPAPARSARPTVSSPTPADFPRVQEGTQKARDGDRRLILEQELAGEQRSLEQARRELAEQAALKVPGNALERTAPYRDRVAQHERNIEALQKELSKLR